MADKCAVPPVTHAHATQIPGSRLHAVYAASFAPAPGGRYFPLAWSPGYKGVPGIDVTAAYIDRAAQARAAP